MTVWLVMMLDYGDCFVAAVFTSEADARAEAARIEALKNLHRGYGVDVVSIELNTPFEWKRG